MPTTIRASRHDHLPGLAWSATLDFDADQLTVMHGSKVEVASEWIVEGVWDGPFSDGDFHRSENFFGSGVRVEGGQVYFVPSSAPIDRLFYCHHGTRLVVTNSLIVLLAMTNATLDPTHDYRKETNAVLKGVRSYDKTFHVSHPSIESFFQVYCESMVVKDRELVFERRGSPTEFADFNDYRARVVSVLKALRRNYEDPLRTTQLDAFSTLSTGYDSPAVSCLAREVGVTQCFTYSGSRTAKSLGDPRLDATPIARTLGLHPILLDSFREFTSEDEIYLYASSPGGTQLPLLAMATYIKENCSAAVVFTGYHGDVVWNVNPNETFLGPDLKRHGISGLDLSELRLHSGFIHLVLPFIFARNVESIVNVSRQDEMKPWRLYNNYDRPIPRRILEEAGVKRTAFGMIKDAILTRQNRPIDPELRVAYASYLREHRRMGSTHFWFRVVTDRVGFKSLKYLSRLTRSQPFHKLHEILVRRHQAFGQGESFFSSSANLKILLYLWAVEALSKRLRETADGPARGGY